MYVGPLTERGGIPHHPSSPPFFTTRGHETRDSAASSSSRQRPPRCETRAASFRNRKPAKCQRPLFQLSSARNAPRTTGALVHFYFCPGALQTLSDGPRQSYVWARLGNRGCFEKAVAESRLRGLTSTGGLGKGGKCSVAWVVMGMQRMRMQASSHLLAGHRRAGGYRALRCGRRGN